MKKTIAVNEDTWKELYKLKLDLGMNNFDSVIFLAIGVLKMIKIVSEEYDLDIISTTKDMIKVFEEYIKRCEYEKRRGI